MRIRNFNFGEITNQDEVFTERRYEMTNEKGKSLGYVFCFQDKNCNLNFYIYPTITEDTDGKIGKRKINSEEQSQFKQFLFNEFATEEQKNFDPLA